jgi:hypothetical protein
MSRGATKKAQALRTQRRAAQARQQSITKAQAIAAVDVMRIQLMQANQQLRKTYTARLRAETALLGVLAASGGRVWVSNETFDDLLTRQTDGFVTEETDDGIVVALVLKDEGEEE